VITAGQTQALQLALRAVCKPGDLVAVEAPCYFGTSMQLRAAGLRMLELRTDAERGLDLAELQSLLALHPVRAVLAQPTANNPAGFTMPLDAKRALVRLLDRAGIPLIEDDVYGELSDPASPAAGRASPCAPA
jgi:DNA-binding transcriptional MocR family regulator